MAADTYRVLYRAFHWYEEIKDVMGETRLVYRDASLGEEIEIPRENDVRRGIASGAIELVSDEASLDADDAEDDSELQQYIDWIRDENPTVQEVIDAASEDPSVAQLLLDAENAVTGNDPRKGIVSGLTAVITRSA